MIPDEPKFLRFDQKPIFNQSKVKNFKFEDHERVYETILI